MLYKPKQHMIIDAGRQGENLARCVLLDVSDMVKDYPNAHFALLVERKGDTAPYPASITVEDGVLEWRVTGADTEIAGDGRVEIRCMLGDVIAKSAVMLFRVSPSITAEPVDAPETYQGWIDDVLDAAADAEENAINASIRARNASDSARTALDAANEASAQAAIAEGLTELANDARLAADSSADIAAEMAVEAATYAGDAMQSALRAEAAASNAGSGTGGSAVIPHIGENGNWYIGDTDTGKPSRGDDGIDGINGKDGIDGINGKDGKDGVNGLDGERGERGYSGLVPKVSAAYASGITVAANTMTDIGVLDGTIVITLGEGVSGYDNEWDFVIRQGGSAMAITLPNIRWGFGIAPTFIADTVTVCRLYYVGDSLCGEWCCV